jgi:hypothetical protein
MINQTKTKSRRTKNCKSRSINRKLKKLKEKQKNLNSEKNCGKKESRQKAVAPTGTPNF